MQIKVLLSCTAMLSVLLSGNGFASDACTSDNILFLVNRPTVADSTCVVSPGNLLIESGFQHRNWVTGSYADIYPITELRLGLPKDTEFYMFLPTYVGNHAPPFAGYTPTVVGYKHEVWGNEKFIATFDALLVPAGGSQNYGLQSAGGRVSGIVGYNISDQWGISAMLNFFYQGQSFTSPDQEFFAVGPDVVLTFLATPKVYIYTEVYGQSRVSPTSGSGYNLDGGLVFLIRNNITFDIEASTRLSGILGNFNNYVGVGGAIQL